MAAATQSRIREWFSEGVSEGYSHLLVVCDTFDYDYYPVFASNSKKAREEYNRRNGTNMQRVEEVYDLSKDIELQLKSRRVLNF